MMAGDFTVAWLIPMALLAIWRSRTLIKVVRGRRAHYFQTAITGEGQNEHQNLYRRLVVPASPALVRRCGRAHRALAFPGG